MTNQEYINKLVSEELQWIDDEKSIDWAVLAGDVYTSVMRDRKDGKVGEIYDIMTLIDNAIEEYV